MGIVLASTSSIRRRLLENAGVPFAVENPTVNEDELKRLLEGLAPEALAQHLAQAKCVSVSHLRPQDMVIGADQVLSFSNRTFGKPASLEEARSQLTQLRGKTHVLISAVCCAKAGSVLWQHTGTAEMTIRNFSNCFLENYLAVLGEDATMPVGAYKLEGRGIQLFEQIECDYFTVLGLPLLPLLSFLRSAGEIAS